MELEYARSLPEDREIINEYEVISAYISLQGLFSVGAEAAWAAIKKIGLPAFVETKTTVQWRQCDLVVAAIDHAPRAAGG
jgi:hypothetical protein